MSSASWLTSLSCSSSVIPTSGVSTTFWSAILWVRFIFLSPCPQRILALSVDLLFLFSLLVGLLRKLCSRFPSKDDSDSSINKPLLGDKTSAPHFNISCRFRITSYVILLLALGFIIMCVQAFSEGIPSMWAVEEAIFMLVRAITHVGIVILLFYEKRSKSVNHPMPLRIFWVANFIVVCALATSSLLRFLLIDPRNVDSNLRVDDIFSFIQLPVALFLVSVATRGATGISEVRESRNNLDENAYEDPNASNYASASWFSKLCWSWMNPLLTKGYKSSLTLDDVPQLPPDFRADRLYERFESNWPKVDENSEHPVRTTLFRCFWKDLLFTGFLAIIKLLISYAGPVLLQSFVDFTAGKQSSPYEGYFLVLTLQMSKIIEVLSSHHLNFESMKLGLRIRSCLISSLYKKGLSLSCSSRQAHGVGRIVNYMGVDAQQLSDMMPQLHPIWLMPFQVALALVLLYKNLGLSMLSSLVGLIAVAGFVLIRTQKNNTYMFNVMINRDSRMKAVIEMINNMRVIKLQAWEKYFGERIKTSRKLEFGWISKFMYSLSTILVVMMNSSTLLADLAFAGTLLLGNRVNAATVFTTTTIFKLLQEPIRNFPQALTQVSQALIALERLDKYMRAGDLEQGSIERGDACSSNIAVEVKNGSFSWDDEESEKVLKDLNLEINKGELAAIVGTVGSGKSSLLASILGEMHKISGKVRVWGTTAYVAQSSWIQNASIQDNILFGLPMNREKYKEAIRACSLEKDLGVLEFGDQTEIGERGINLSGGQKQRIQLARAVYQDCDIYLLDDVFSAVDAQTGSELFKECVRGALRNKTVLLVTHQVDFLQNADLILVMREGRIVQSGKYEELLYCGTDFSALVSAHETSMELVGKHNTTADKSEKMQKSANSSIQVETSGKDRFFDRSKSQKKGTAKLIKEEEKETGHVNWGVYKNYMTKSYGWWGVALVVLFSLAWQGCTMASDVWLSYETSEDRVFVPRVFISVYSIIIAVSCVVVLIRSFYVTFLGLKTAESFFDQLLNSILHAPMAFFDTTPSGRILSRMSGDQVCIDIIIPTIMGMTLVMYFMLIGILAMTCLTSWPSVFLLIPLIWMNIWYRGYYIATSRELTRISSITRAPIIHHFSETISGITTIRSFRKQTAFVQENIRKLDASLKTDFHNNGANEWLGFRIELMGSFVLCMSTLFLILLPRSIVGPEDVGLALSYGLPLDGVLFYATFMACTLENRMVSIERMEQFINIPSEAAWENPSFVPPAEWPSRGNIALNDVKVRYRPNTPLVLKGITLSIDGGEKIGIVGRTGSGKSTLIQVLFRLVEPSYGNITVDGIDICKLGLHDLRSRFGIIPQDPVLFQGTVRSNIDPIGLYSDEEIWKTLERCQLKGIVAEKPEKLDSLVAESGENWSMGQRQLLCLGRVLLKQARILFMDEATASVDSQTDAVIQKIIRDDFAACTIISIAHRIPTIMDCDRVLVIDDGHAQEFDKPSLLLERPSIFSKLVQEYANRASEL